MGSVSCLQVRIFVLDSLPPKNEAILTMMQETEFVTRHNISNEISYDLTKI